MKLTKSSLNTLIAGAFATTMIAGAATAFAEDEHAAPADTEKCYGVAKAGKNDCASAAGTHSCAGQAATDSEGGEWLSLPKGVCERLAGGSLEPITEEEVEEIFVIEEGDSGDSSQDGAHHDEEHHE